ncbi:MAG TPA: hypothetical protein PK472_10185 [Pseudomonadota bacterium]|nr:hypothetical protein [Pseudomonadota bacterium]HNN52294.1 hypothetical protein [Pseudomonadota bacterium]
MKRRLTVFACGAFLFTASSAFAQAKAPAPTDAKAESERAGKEGERLLAAHDAAGAVTELGKAYSLSKNPRFLLPLGLAFAEVGRPLDALDALGRFLKESPTLPDQKRREIGAKLGVMLDQVAGTVNIEASRQNAQIKLDGRVIGMSPIETPLRLNPGKHELQMVPAPTDPSSGATVVIDIKPGEQKAIKLEPSARSKFLEPQVSNQDADPALRTTAANHQSVSTQAEPATKGSEFNFRDLPKKWWFWTGVGAVAAVGIGLGVGLGVGLRDRSTPPTESFPAVTTWPGGPIDVRMPSVVAQTFGY